MPAIMFGSPEAQTAGDALVEYEKAHREWAEAFDANAPGEVVTTLHKRATEAWERYCALRDAR